MKKKSLYREATMKNILILMLTIPFIWFSSGCDGSDKPFEEGFESQDDKETTDEEIKKDETSAYRKAPANVQRWPMVATGQARCFNSFEEIPCPKIGEPFYGQDGTYQLGLRSYIDNNDGTVFDSVTGLTWQQGFSETAMTWYEAKSYCENLTLAGYMWRIPLTHELKSLVNYDTYNPAIDEDEFPDTPSDWFWGSKHVHFDEYSGGSEPASWIISFKNGFVEYTGRYNKYYVRCVKSN
jgi:hypothetical protein